MDSKQTTAKPDENRDLITGEPGAHPAGVGVGMAVGVVAGGVVGALLGRAVAETVHPTQEDAYWRQNYTWQPYVPYGDYPQAYEYGWATRSRYPGRRFEDAEAELRGGWEQARAKLPWDKARLAVRDAWGRIDLWHVTSPDAGDAPTEEGRPL
jgi:hypothetical protein